MAGVDGVTRADAEALFAEAVSPNVAEQATKSSVALATLPTLPMGSKVTRLPVLSALPTGAFLNADQDAKPLSEVAWDKKMLTAEEIAVIVPISESVIADASIDVVAKVTELIGQEFGRVIDAAVFFGTGAPATFPTGGLFGTAPSGQKSEATGVVVDDLNTLFGSVEDLGFDVTNVYAGRGMRSTLRGQKDANGAAVYNPAEGAGQFGSIWGVPLGFPLAWNKATADAIAVDRAGVMLGVRQDVTIKLLTEATLTGFGNLAEKDSVAVRAVMRVAFQIANPVSIDAGARAYPVSALTPKPVTP
jgi:HK97 family phage major capsid protein